MNRPLLLIAALTAALLHAGCAPACGPSTCDGCCDTNDVCRSMTADACGQGGGACTACAPLQQCIAGVCGFQSFGGTYAGTGGSGGNAGSATTASGTGSGTLGSNGTLGGSSSAAGGTGTRGSGDGSSSGGSGSTGTTAASSATSSSTSGTTSSSTTASSTSTATSTTSTSTSSTSSTSTSTSTTSSSTTTTSSSTTTGGTLGTTSSSTSSTSTSSSTSSTGSTGAGVGGAQLAGTRAFNVRTAMHYLGRDNDGGVTTSRVTLVLADSAYDCAGLRANGGYLPISTTKVVVIDVENLFGFGLQGGTYTMPTTSSLGVPTSDVALTWKEFFPDGGSLAYGGQQGGTVRMPQPNRTTMTGDFNAVLGDTPRSQLTGSFATVYCDYP